MTNSFLILFITIKAEITLILQGVSINTHSVVTKKNILYTYLILFHHHSHIHTSFLISLQKKRIEGGRQKEEENILYTLSSSHYHPHRHLSSLSLLEKQTQIRKGSKNKKEKRKGEELKIFKVHHSQFFQLLI